MKKINVGLGRNRYEIYVGAGLLPRTGHWLKKKGFSGKLVVITDTVVMERYGDALTQGLARDGFRVTTLQVPDGEEQKSLETAGRLYQELTDAYAERSTPVLALGGGGVGDLAGFVAATYMRGVPLVQVPTTLLAQVDSSIGGKVAVDHGRLKNKIGAFYQPELVIADTDTLRTLPEIELASGLAEIIKSAAIRDKELFTFLEHNLDKVKALQGRVLEEVVYRTAKIKARIVKQDERDLGIRSILNYGHTIGHAIESVSEFGVGHGRAVAIGMVTAARISREMGALSEAEVVRLTRIIEQAGLPTEMPALDRAGIVEAIRHDKKVQDDKVRFILLKSIGDAFITDGVSLSLVEKVLAEDD